MQSTFIHQQNSCVVFVRLCVCESAVYFFAVYTTHIRLLKNLFLFYRDWVVQAMTW